MRRLISSAKDILTKHQTQVVDRVLEEEEKRREHLVVALSGSHAYGFPSPDSDLDVKAVHVEMTVRLMSLTRGQHVAERLEVVDGVEVDYSSNEIHPVLLGALQGNGNFLERILGAMALRESAELEGLKPVVQRSLSRRIHRHYRGLASGQLKEWEKSGFRSAKRLLYILRTTLTGTRALRTGEVVTDMTQLLDADGFEAARELVDQKRRGELAKLPPKMSERWRGQVARAFELLDLARDRSSLPVEPPNVPEVEAWLQETRRMFY